MAEMLISRARRLSQLLALTAMALPSAAQVSQAPADPLARMRAAAAGNGASQACSVSETSACAQANPKILANALGSTVFAENLKQLAALGARSAGNAAMAKAVAWSESAFRAAGVDTVSTEGPGAAEEVVAEIRGRENPDEFVLVTANLLDSDCHVAVLVEAARDIHLTGLRPRRSIRFVLFTSRSAGLANPVAGPWAYVRTHSDEADRMIAAIGSGENCGAISGFNLPGREELEAGVRNALDFAPIKPWGIDKDTYAASADGLDFLLEGVPVITANQGSLGEKNDSETPKRNAAVTAILAFGLAEHSTPLGPRLTRPQIEALLERTGLKARMESTEAALPEGATPPFVPWTVWKQWESGDRGRKR